MQIPFRTFAFNPLTFTPLVLQDEDNEEEPAAETANYSRSVCNPVYEASPEPAPTWSDASGSAGNLQASVNAEVSSCSLLMLSC